MSTDKERSAVGAAELEGLAVCPACYGAGDTTNEGELWCDLSRDWGIPDEASKREAAYSWSRTGTQDPCPVCGGRGNMTHADAVAWLLERHTK